MKKTCMDANSFRFFRIIISLTIFILLFIFMGSARAFASEPDFTVSYSDLHCGTPMTFTVNVSNPNPSSTYKYYLNFVNGYSDGAREYVADPSRMPGYQESNEIAFTFYASGSYEMRFYVMEETENGSLNFCNRTISFTINDPGYPTIEEIADNIVAQCLAAGCSTDYEKALWLHDYIISNMKYDYSYVYCGAEGALARGTGICEAYHRGYCMLLKRAGVECGRIENRTKLYHVWTNVKMDGIWYQVDCTWDDQDGHSGLTPYEEHLYFGANETIMDKRSTPNLIVGDKGSFSDSLANNFFIKSGHVHEYSDIYIAQIQSHLDQGDTSFTIDVTNGFRDDYYYNTNNALFYPVAYQLSSETWTTAQGGSATVSVTYGELKLNVSVTYESVTPTTILNLSLPAGYNDTEVYIDGVKYSGTISNGIFTTDLTKPSAKTAVMYKYNANSIPSGMYVWKIQYSNGRWNATPLTGLEDLLSYHGFSIRYTGKSGIRFKSGISTTTKAKLKSSGVDGYKLVEIGSMYMIDSNRSTYPFIKGGEKVSTPGRSYYTSNGTIIDSVFETVSGRDRFTNVLTNIPSTNYATMLAFRSYVVLKDNSGEEIIVYGPILSRSIYSIAKQLVGRGDFPAGSAGYIYMNNIITTVEGN